MIEINNLKIEDQSWLDKTVELAGLVKAEPSFNIRQACAECDISERWFYALINKENKDYHINKVQSLYNFLVRFLINLRTVKG